MNKFLSAGFYLTSTKSEAARDNSSVFLIVPH